MTFDAVGIVAENPEKSVAFYALLGVRFERAGGADHYEAKTPSGVRIMLDSVALIRSLDPEWQKPNGSGIVLCFKQDAASDVDRVHDAIVAAGHRSKKAPWDAFWGQRYACVLDPDGNQVDLFAPLAK
jgi:catechol 2,3-dioxygenase-like lactoylglutathione lyase family enzyme